MWSEKLFNLKFRKEENEEVKGLDGIGMLNMESCWNLVKINNFSEIKIKRFLSKKNWKKYLKLLWKFDLVF